MVGPFCVEWERRRVREEVGQTGRRVGVLIVDDTATIRRMIRALLEGDPRLCVLGEAADPYEARELIKRLRPDVLTLDVEMPRMNGLVFLEKLMRLRPMPVVMVSTRTAEQTEDALTALSLGAIDCVDLRLLRMGDTRVAPIGDTLVAAARSPIARRTRRPLPVPTRQSGPASVASSFRWNGRFVVMGSSTGGVDALLTVLSGFPKNCAPAVIAQHMPPHFIESFAARLDAMTPPVVRVARDGDALVQGRILLAPGGDFHAALTRDFPPRITLVRDRSGYLHVPSVACLFGSAAAHSRKAVGVMLTGMGRDGAREMKSMRDAGARTIVQSGPTSTVDGMPRAARELGAAEEVVPLDAISHRILSLTGTQRGVPRPSP